jgi:2-hydroxychromene-2-carboxylate isomerase
MSLLRSIDYYDSMSSPWTYLGHLRFLDLARRFDLTRLRQKLDAPRSRSA